MNLMEHKKFEEEFIRELILYIDYPAIQSIERKEISLEEFNES